MKKRSRWNPRKFKRNMRGLAGGVAVMASLGTIFFVLTLLAYGPWM